MTSINLIHLWNEKWNCFQWQHSRKKRGPLYQAFRHKLTPTMDMSAPQWIVDATMGLGGDSLLLLSWGFHVMSCERNPQLIETIQRALVDPDLNTELKEMLNTKWFFHAGDAKELTISSKPWGIYLDPMYSLPPEKKTRCTKEKHVAFAFSGRR